MLIYCVCALEEQDLVRPLQEANCGGRRCPSESRPSSSSPTAGSCSWPERTASVPPPQGRWIGTCGLRTLRTRSSSSTSLSGRYRLGGSRWSCSQTSPPRRPRISGTIVYIACVSVNDASALVRGRGFSCLVGERVTALSHHRWSVC